MRTQNEPQASQARFSLDAFADAMSGPASREEDVGWHSASPRNRGTGPQYYVEVASAVAVQNQPIRNGPGGRTSKTNHGP